MIVKHREPVIEAWQWMKQGDPPMVLSSYTGWTIDPADVKPLVVPYNKHQLLSPDSTCSCGAKMECHGLFGSIVTEKVCPGDYIVKENGDYFHMSEDEFHARYEEV